MSKYDWRGSYTFPNPEDMKNEVYARGVDNAYYGVNVKVNTEKQNNPATKSKLKRFIGLKQG